MNLGEHLLSHIKKIEYRTLFFTLISVSEVVVKPAAHN